jgi:hypothetical protein
LDHGVVHYFVMSNWRQWLDHLVPRCCGREVGEAMLAVDTWFLGWGWELDHGVVHYFVMSNWRKWLDHLVPRCCGREDGEAMLAVDTWFLGWELGVGPRSGPLLCHVELAAEERAVQRDGVRDVVAIQDRKTIDVQQALGDGEHETEASGRELKSTGERRRGDLASALVDRSQQRRHRVVRQGRSPTNTLLLRVDGRCQQQSHPIDLGCGRGSFVATGTRVTGLRSF